MDEKDKELLSGSDYLFVKDVLDFFKRKNEPLTSLAIRHKLSLGSFEVAFALGYLLARERIKRKYHAWVLTQS